MKKYIYIASVVVAILLLFYFCSKPSLEINDDTTSTTTTSVRVDTFIKTDTIVSVKTNTIHFETTKYVPTYVIPDGYVLDTSIERSLLNLYKDTIVNEDGIFKSSIVSSGRIYDHKLTYELLDTSFKTTEIRTIDSIIHTIERTKEFVNKVNILQVYAGVYVGQHSFNPNAFNPTAFDIKEVAIGPKLSIIINETHNVSYQYDVLNKEHGVFRIKPKPTITKF
jgi:hypothetical protein